MTGLLPHNHGVLYVTHTVDEDQAALRTDHPHWAQRLLEAGYRTGYFGKWHVERTNDLKQFGWQEQAEIAGKSFPDDAQFSLEKWLDYPPGYRPNRFYGVCDVPSSERGMGKKVTAALNWLETQLGGDDPWCCFVSVTEPHDPFYCSEEAFARYDLNSLPLQPNVHDDLGGRPGIYRKAARVWQNWTDDEHREATACYYASITEIDAEFGRILDRLEAAGQMENTLVVLTSDHGELLGSHGLYCKNYSAAEEIYNVPLVVAGPGVATGATSDARVGLHDLCPTLLEMVGLAPITHSDSRSFAPILASPQETAGFETGYAEYFGGRTILTQRVVWNGDWKFVFNGFDFDELYNLADDPYEMTNLAENPACAEQLATLTGQMWDIIERTGDHSLLNSHYPILRVAPVGPLQR
jgi:arylsulfatase A-like enzyme